ncbi:MAG: hypothetical protein J6S13_02495 [Clostridia bacterium]|nr:hypothetical protein [Clostridia bacterium]
MKRKVCMIITLLAAIIIIVNTVFAARDEFVRGMDNLPQGTLLREDMTNQNLALQHNRFLAVYQIPATDNHPAAIRVTVAQKVYAENTDVLITDDIRTIYWQIGTTASAIYWSEEDENIVYINDVPINYLTGSYDCRDYNDFKYKPLDNDSQFDRKF